MRRPGRLIRPGAKRNCLTVTDFYQITVTLSIYFLLISIFFYVIRVTWPISSIFISFVVKLSVEWMPAPAPSAVQFGAASTGRGLIQRKARHGNG